MKKSEFEYWLKNYKELTPSKASNICKRLIEFSDRVCASGYSCDSIFSNNTFVNLAKWKQKISKQIDIPVSTKKDLDLLGEYLEIKNITKLPYHLSSEPALAEYVEKMKMSFSYKAVLILIMIKRIKCGEDNEIDFIIEDIINFYRDRINAGEIAEKKESLFSNYEVTDSEAKRIIVNNPISVLEKAGILFCNVDNKICFSSDYYIEKEDLELVESKCKSRLITYYEKLTHHIADEKSPEQKLKDAILSISSSEEKERCLLAYKECFTPAEIDDKADYSLLLISNEDERKIGKIVQDSMQKLSESGFIFDNSLYSLFYTKEWSKKTLGLYYALFKSYDPSQPIENQTKDHRNNNRYYGKVFTFGECQVLLTSEWYKESKELYINWFNSLLKPKN